MILNDGGRLGDNLISRVQPRVWCEPKDFLDLLSHLGPHDAPPIFFTEDERGLRTFYLFGSGYAVITTIDSENNFMSKLKDVSAIVRAARVEA